MAAHVESWDDDLDFQGRGDLFAHSVSTVQTSMSSRMSVNSESNAFDEDWHVQMTADDDISVTRAVQSAKAAGVPLPHNIPPSALVGGSIKRLGKKNIRPKQNMNDDWGEDLDLPTSGLLPKSAEPCAKKPDIKDESADLGLDGFDSDWAEGSLGIRFAGTRKAADVRGRSSSVSAMSPSLESQTAESEDDDLRGLEFPEGPVNLKAALETRQAAQADRPVAEHLQLRQPTAHSPSRPSTFLDRDVDFFNELDVGKGDVFDTQKLTLHKNIRQKTAKHDSHLPTRTPTTTLTFTERPTITRIPRPVPATSKQVPPSRLAPVMETGAVAHVTRTKPQPTTTHAQLLRSKRSMPMLRSQYTTSVKPQPVYNMSSKNMAYNLRNDADAYRAQSPPPARPLSRLSTAYVPDTPSRTSRRPDPVVKDLVREAATKKTLTRPQRRRHFGDGTELEVFDDLPTSAAKESKWVKPPSLRGPRSMRSVPSRLNLREQISDSRLNAMSDKMVTPVLGPQTPSSLLKMFQEPSSTPSYLRDTAASRIARESRLAQGSSLRPRSDAYNSNTATNWKAQIAARSPHASPSTQRARTKRVQPGLIRPGDAPVNKHEKGMTYNAITQQWEGNENVLGVFDFAPPPPSRNTASRLTDTPVKQPQRPALQPVVSASPPRPALIAPMSAGTGQNIQVVGGMVFDPARMCWLKFKAADHPGHQRNVKDAPTETEDDDDDPFAGIEDLGDAVTDKNGNKTTGAGPGGRKDAVGGEWPVGEEFDLGPDFIKRQQDEEVIWRARCQAWYPNGGVEGPRLESQRWKWRIREIAGAR